MFDKKIILLISLLLITGSSYFIFHRKKNNDDEVNIVDNSDNSINDDLNEEESINEDAESSSSFLKYSILFIIVIIVAVIAFFAIKRIVNKKKKKKEETENKEEEELKLIEDKNIKNKIPELKKDQNYPKEFKDYIYIREKPELKNLIEKLSAQKDMKKITDAIIEQMKKDYIEKENEIAELKTVLEGYYADNYFLVDFYFGKDGRLEKDEGNVGPNEAYNNEDIFFRNDENKKRQRAREISVFKPNYRYIIVNLFITFFEKFAAFEEFKEKPNVLLDENSLDQEFYVFIAVIIQPFLYYVSQRKEKDVRFIGTTSTIVENFQDFCSTICDIAKKENLDGFGDDIKKPDLSSIKNFVCTIFKEKIDTFAIIFNGLINYYFPESKKLNEAQLENE